MEQVFLQNAAKYGLAQAFAIMWQSALVVGMLIMVIVFPLLQDVARWLARKLTGRTQSGHKIHRDHIDPRLETWQ